MSNPLPRDTEPFTAGLLFNLDIWMCSKETVSSLNVFCDKGALIHQVLDSPPANINGSIYTLSIQVIVMNLFWKFQTRRWNLQYCKFYLLSDFTV